jgi:hypothetical protein
VTRPPTVAGSHGSQEPTSTRSVVDMGAVPAARPLGRQELRTPSGAAVAGIVFALLLGTSLTLIWTSLPAGPEPDIELLRERIDTVRVGLTLMPFAGIAFLWFVGVIRDLLGDQEDRFFATVLLGSGILYLAMTFAAAGLAGGLLGLVLVDVEDELMVALFTFSREATRTIVTAYAIRMAGVFMMTFATIVFRTRTMPRWVPLVTVVLAIVLLFTVPRTLWAILVFPTWVLGMSVVILLRRSARGAGDPLSSPHG